MPKTLIRSATTADFLDLLDIDQESFPEGIAYDAGELAYFMSRRGADTLVLEHDGDIAAFLIADTRTNQRAATIVTLDVRPPFRRLGYASRLLQESEQILKERGVREYRLQVDVNNAAAIAFYRKYGFERVRTLRQYYSNGHDAYLMTKALLPT